MHWVVQLCAFKSHRVKGDWSGRLPSFAKRQNGSRFGVTSICSDRDFQCWHLRVVNCCEAVLRKYKSFDLVKGLLMSCRPRIILFFSKNGKPSIIGTQSPGATKAKIERDVHNPSKDVNQKITK